MAQSWVGGPPCRPALAKGGVTRKKAKEKRTLVLRRFIDSYGRIAARNYVALAIRGSESVSRTSVMFVFIARFPTAWLCGKAANVCT